jgi:hypothetical protein
MGEKDGKRPQRLISAAQLADVKPEEYAAYYVTKEDFFALTSLAGMSRANEEDPRSIDAAEATYVRWVQTGRVKEIRVVVEDPTGEMPDQVSVFVEARYINSERRRENQQKRRIEEARAAMQHTLPPALRS